MNVIIKNGSIITEDRVLRGTLIIEEGIIRAIGEGEFVSCNSSRHYEGFEFIDAEGLFVMPGLVDLHCDALEQTVQPRKKVFFPIELALKAVQVQALSAGITSMFHAISCSGEPGIRSNEKAHQIAGEIGRFRGSKDSRMRHYIHMRYEIYNETGRETMRGIFGEGLVDLFSVMDHSAKYSRFKDFGQYRSYVEKNSTLTGEALDRYAIEQWEKNGSSNEEIENEMIELAKTYDVKIASHDDVSSEVVEVYRKKGVSMSEFPLNEDAAGHAMKKGLYSIVGAPNIFRNKSHAGNLSARYAIKNNLANIVCSDYYCFCLLASAFLLHEEGVEMSKAVACATINPARAAGIADRTGSLVPGKAGDIILVRHSQGQLPIVERAMVGGRWAYIKSFE